MILFVQLHNDYSGSARVLRTTLQALDGGESHAHLLYVGRGDGLLSRPPVARKTFWYRRSRFRLLRLASLFCSQVILFFRLLADRQVPRDALIYVNTLLPFGAALYGKVTGRSVIYHVHEASVIPRPLLWFLTRIARLTSSLAIYVSDAHRRALPIRGVAAQCVYNTVDPELARRAAASTYRHRRDGVFRVLMVAYLRDYKGIREFVALARDLQNRPDIEFQLLANGGSSEELARYVVTPGKPDNLKVFLEVEDVACFYERASLVVNLSRVDQCVETFGMTLLEAMAFGIPVIAPPAGGPSELLTDGVEGYLVDSRDSAALRERVLKLADCQQFAEMFSTAARRRSADFGFDDYTRAIRSAVASLTNDNGCSRSD